MAATAMRRSTLRLASDPNVIPFIDVLLVLLIIFMVTAPKPTTDLQLDLSVRGEPRAYAIPPTIVEIRSSGDGFAVFIGSEETTLQELGADALAYMTALEPLLEPADAYADGRIYVRADLDVAYQNVVTVVETLQDARFQKVSIFAQRADDS